MRASMMGIGLVLALVLYASLHIAIERLPAGLVQLPARVLIEQPAAQPGSAQTQHVDFSWPDNQILPYVLIVARAQQFGVYWRGETLAQGGQAWQGAASLQLHALRGADSGALRAYYLSQPWPLDSGLAIYSGPAAELVGLEQQWRVLQQQLPSLSALFALVIGLLMLALWAQQREVTAYFWVGLMALSWAGLAAGWSGHFPDNWGYAGLLLAPVALAATSLGLTLHWRGSSGHDLLLSALAGLCALLYVAWQDSPRLAYLLAAVGLTFCMLWQLRIIWSGRGPGVWLSLPLSLTGLGAAHDAHMLAGLSDDEPILMLALLAPVLLLALAWWLLAGFVDSLRSTQAQNRLLDALVAEKTSELEEQYQQMQVLENQRVLDQERQRLLREIHDGVGGHLVSTLALVESADTSRDSIGEALRDALTDMRLMVDSLDDVDEDLNAVLASFRLRIEPRLRAAGVSLTWQVEDLPRIDNLGPSRILNVLRVLQEAVTNVIKHAHASRIVLSARATTQGAAISLCDDGVGLPDGANPQAGYGLLNMRQRAQAGGFELELANASDGGCCLHLTLAIELAAPPDNDPVMPRTSL